MKIAYILPSLDNQGPIVAAYYLVKSLLNHVDLIDVYYFKDKHKLDFPVNTTKIGFFSRIDFSQYDVVHSYGALPDIYLAKNRHKVNAKIVTTMHNYLTKDLSMLYGPLKGFFYKHLWLQGLSHHKNIIVSTNDMKGFYKNLLSGQKNYSIIEYGVSKGKPNYLQGDEIHFLNNLKFKYTIIGSVGLLIKRKGYHQLVHFLKDNPHYAVLIIGDGEEYENLQSLATKFGVSDRFILLGYKDNSVDYYPYFDQYAMVSYSEGCSLAMIQAMSLRLPIICSDILNHRDCFTDFDVSFFTLDDVTSLTQAIYAISSSTSFSESAYEVYSSKFSLDSMSKKHLSFYEHLI